MPEYEYGIIWNSLGGPNDPHREGMTLEEAKDWIKVWEDHRRKFDISFRIIRRPVSQWEHYEESPEP